MIYSHFSSILEPLREKGGKVVLALSGGVDSRVLLHLLSLYRNENPQLKCVAVHVHHGLSTYADDWAEKCIKWCDGYNIESNVERVTLELGSQVSTEQEARNKRYQVLEKFVNKNDVLITGQHSSDQTESFLLALKRGSGPKGLSSMPESIQFNQGHIVRPLLAISQEQIVQYALDEKLDWVEDESNQDIKYDRNFLRHQVIPVLKSRWPEIESSVLRSAKLCGDQELLLQELLQQKLEDTLTEDKGLSISTLFSQSELVRNQLIRMWLEKHSALMPSFKQLVAIWKEVAIAKEDANPTLNLTSGMVRRYQGILYFLPKYQDISGWSSELILGGTLLLPDGLGVLEFTEKVSPGKIGLRAPLGDENVMVHFNPEGLIAHPSNRNHSRKLKKLYQEYKIPSWRRKRMPIIMYGDAIAMVAGLFIDKNFQGYDCEIIWNKV